MLAVGGQTKQPPPALSFDDLSTAEVIGTATGTWGPAAPVVPPGLAGFPRVRHSAVLLGTGDLLLIGGNFGDPSSRLCHTGTRTWARAGQTIQLTFTVGEEVDPDSDGIFNLL